MMHSNIFFFSPVAPLTQPEKQDYSCFIGWGDYFVDIVHTGSGKPWYTQQTENWWTTMTHLETPNTQCRRVQQEPSLRLWKEEQSILLTVQSFWPRCSSTHWYLFSLTVLRGSTSAANRRLSSAYSWPERQPANRQKTITPIPIEELETSPYTHEKDLDVCSCINLASTLPTKLQRPRKASYQAIIESPHWGRRLYPVTTAWSWHCLQTSSLKTKEVYLLKQLWQNHFRKYCGSHVFERSLFEKQPSNAVCESYVLIK